MCIVVSCLLRPCRVRQSCWTCRSRPRCSRIETRKGLQAHVHFQACSVFPGVMQNAVSWSGHKQDPTWLTSKLHPSRFPSLISHPAARWKSNFENNPQRAQHEAPALDQQNTVVIQFNYTVPTPEVQYLPSFAFGLATSLRALRQEEELNALERHKRQASANQYITHPVRGHHRCPAHCDRIPDPLPSPVSERV
jgi:hypothetical protein